MKGRQFIEIAMEAARKKYGNALVDGKGEEKDLQLLKLNLICKLDSIEDMDTKLILSFTIKSIEREIEYRKVLKNVLNFYKDNCGFMSRGANRERAKVICKVLYGHDNVGLIQWKE